MTGLRLQGRGKHGPSERARGKPPAGPGSRTSQHEPGHPVPFPWGRGDVLSRLHWGAAWSGPAESLGGLGGAAGAPCTGTVGWHRPPDLKHLGGLGQGLWGGLTVMQFLTLKSGGSWRGMGWLGRCPEKGRAVSFLLWISWGEAGHGTFPCVPHHRVKAIRNPSSWAHRRQLGGMSAVLHGEGPGSPSRASAAAKALYM